MVANLTALGHGVDLDLEPLRHVERTLGDIAALDGFPSGAPATYRIDHYLHQIPGGMISNLRHQLQQAGVAHRIPEVLEEVVRVRADFGYPIMVTPLSQFVGSQAAVNVISGSRYGVVTDSSIEYALGLHGGDEALMLMDQDVRDRILAHPRVREVAARRAEPLPSLAELRVRYGPRVPDEDLIMLAIMGDDALALVGSFAEVRLDEPPAPDMLTTVRRALAEANEQPVILTAPGMTLAVAQVRGPQQEP